MLRARRRHEGLQDGHVREDRADRGSGVSFAVQPGEVVSLIGESGSGKTTVGRMILRLTGATAGTITFDGRDVSSLGRRELRRYYGHVQGVFQDPFSSYNPVFKVDRVLGMIRSSYLPGLSARTGTTQLRTSLEAVALEPADVLGKYPHQLSGGQLQRLMIARALLLDIQFLVADEIISMLDASTRIDVLNLLGDLKARGVGILFITHDLSLGNYISDKTLILRHGRIAEYGPTPKVFGNPSHPYTQALLASVPQLHRNGRRPPGRPSRERRRRCGRPTSDRGRPRRGRGRPFRRAVDPEEESTVSRVALQLYTVRDECAPTTSRARSRRPPSLGFDGVELYDLHGHAPESVRALLDGNGLVACGRHAALAAGRERARGLAAAARRARDGQAGRELDRAPRDGGERPRRSTDRFVAAAERAAGSGYGSDSTTMPASSPASTTAARSSIACSTSTARTLFLELDLGWVWYAGVDPIALLERAGARAPLVHVKDMRRRRWARLRPARRRAVDYGRLASAAAARGCGVADRRAGRDGRPGLRRRRASLVGPADSWGLAVA